MSADTGIARCPHCDRTVRTIANRYYLHNTGEYDQVCPMSEQRVPITGDTPMDYVARAKLVANLASQVQDFDPAIVWSYLTALPGSELQRLMMVALAAIPLDKTVDEMFSWVTALPAARVVSA